MNEYFDQEEIACKIQSASTTTCKDEVNNLQQDGVACQLYSDRILHRNCCSRWC